MSPITEPMKKDSTRAWVAGLAVTLTTIVAYLAFWHLAPGLTFIIGCVSLAALLVAGWVLGGEVTQKSEKEPRQRSGLDE